MSELGEKLDAGHFVVTAEMPVIDGGGVPEVLYQLEFMRPYVDAYNTTDNPAAHAHASSLSVAIALRHAGVEPIMQLSCRDRNRLALQADLMGAAMHGIDTVSCMTGDDVTAGDEPETRRVFDVDSPQLVAIARALTHGHYLSGRALDPSPRFTIGAVENPSAPPLHYRVRRAAKKALAGARFLQLQLCYRPQQLEDFVGGAREIGLTDRLAIIPSICILRTVGGMRFVARHVPGIDVPPETLARIEAAEDPKHECFELAYELASHAMSLPGVAGLHFISFRKDAGIAKLCERLGIPPREIRQQTPLLLRPERGTDGHSAPLTV
jgi:methylenetetrahydrofolate reductase (NADPH)